MSYNVLNLPDGSIEGHKYSLMESQVSNTNYDLTVEAPINITAVNDGMFSVSFWKPGGGGSIIVAVNGNVVERYAAWGSGVASSTLIAFVKKGDIIRVYTDTNADRYRICECKIIKYR